MITYCSALHGNYGWLLENKTQTCHTLLVQRYKEHYWHYNNVIMSAMASQITSLTIACSFVNSVADQRKHQRSASLAFVRGTGNSPVTGEFPAQMASNTKNLSIWWRHHEQKCRWFRGHWHKMSLLLKIIPEWPWTYRSNSKVSVQETPSDGSDHLCLLWKWSIQNCRCDRADAACGMDIF